MSRVQLAINVADLDEAVASTRSSSRHRPEGAPGLRELRHRRTAAEARAHRRRRCARNAEPPRRRGRDTDAVAAAHARLESEGLTTATEDDVACCYARQDKVWVDAPDGEPWEIYTVLDDVEMPNDELCCGSAPESAARCC